MAQQYNKIRLRANLFYLEQNMQSFIGGNYVYTKRFPMNFKLLKGYTSTDRDMERFHL